MLRQRLPHPLLDLALGRDRFHAQHFCFPKEALHDLGAIVRGYDPPGMEQAKPLLPDVQYCHSANRGAESADAVVIATEWEQFSALDLSRLKGVMTRPVLVDLRNICRTEEMKRAAFSICASWSGPAFAQRR